jgi:hypothetical protein
MHVELWANSKGKSRIMALIRATDREVSIEAREPVPERIREDIEDQRARVTGEEAFLRSLLLEFSGTYYRASFIKD